MQSIMFQQCQFDAKLPTAILSRWIFDASRSAETFAAMMQDNVEPLIFLLQQPDTMNINS